MKNKNTHQKINNLDFPNVLTENGEKNVYDIWEKENTVVGLDSMLNNSSIDFSQINDLAINSTFLGWGELSLLQQNETINNICTVLSDSLTEKWIKIISNSENNKEKIKELTKEFEKFNVQKIINECVYNTFLFGTSYLSIKLKNDENDLINSLPLHNDLKIKKGDLEYINTIEPTWVVPIDFNMNKPRLKNFYKPQSYNVFGDKIHNSRLLQMIYIKPCNILSPMYLFGGIPLSQLLLIFVLNFQNSNQQINQIISRFNTNILKTNIDVLSNVSEIDEMGVSMNQSSSINQRLANFIQYKDNHGVFLLGEDEDFKQIQIPLNGLKDLLQQQAEFISLISRIPVSKLFGQAPNGMNATGEFDAKNFNQSIESTQQKMIKPILDKIIKILMLNLWGEIDNSISYEFNEIGNIDEIDNENIKNNKVNRASQMIASNIINPNEAKQHLSTHNDILETGDN